MSYHTLCNVELQAIHRHAFPLLVICVSSEPCSDPHMEAQIYQWDEVSDVRHHGQQQMPPEPPDFGHGQPPARPRACQNAVRLPGPARFFGGPAGAGKRPARR